MQNILGKMILISICWISIEALGAELNSDPSLPTNWKKAAEEWKHFQENPPMTEQDRLRASRLANNKLAVMAVQASKANFSIRANVVDEVGKALKEVKLDVVYLNAPTFSQGGGGGVHEVFHGGKADTQVIDEKFEVHAEGSWGMGLKFNKAGYREANLEFDGDALTPDKLKSLLGGGIVEPSLMVENGLQVELTWVNKQSSSILELGNKILLDVSGKGNSVVLDRSMPAAGQFIGRVDAAKKGFDTIEQMRVLPANAFSVEVKLSDDGKTFAFSNTKTPHGTILPAQVTIRFNAKDGGVVLTEPHHHRFYFMPGTSRRLSAGVSATSRRHSEKRHVC